MRVTKVNALGRPVYGANSFVTTSGFVSVQFSPEIEDGEETTVKTASGEICVSEKACDELKWITVQIEFCQVDPCLFTLINETWTELRDCVGEVIGWAESHKFSCDSGFALELWTDVTGYTPTTPGAQGAWGFLLLPFIVGGTLGEQTVENGAISFTITGRTKKGSNWGVGPYDVMCNDAATGACGPLLTPVSADEPRRIMLTTCPPPAAACGCQPLSAPDGPPFTVVEVPPDSGQPRRRVSALIPSGTLGTYKVSWGDGSAVEDLLAGTPLVHTYERNGSFGISVWDTSNTQKVTVRTAAVPFTGAVTPTITVVEEPGDATHKTARVTVTNPVPGRSYEVKWEDSQVDWDDLPTTGGTPNSLAHLYTTADGAKTVTVRDKADPSKTAQKSIIMPWPQAVVPILLTTEEGTVTPRRQVRATVTNAVQGRSYQVLFEGSTWEDLPIAGPWANSLTHIYASDGAKTVQVRDKDATTQTDSDSVTLPYTGATFALGQNGSATMGAAVTVTNPTGGVTYEVQWENAAGTWADLAGSPPAGTHTYASGGTYGVTVRDKAIPVTTASTKQVRVPFGSTVFGATSEPSDEPLSASDSADATSSTAAGRKRAK
jgi:hypothetical protein